MLARERRGNSQGTSLRKPRGREAAPSPWVWEACPGPQWGHALCPALWRGGAPCGVTIPRGLPPHPGRLRAFPCFPLHKLFESLPSGASFLHNRHPCQVPGSKACGRSACLCGPGTPPPGPPLPRHTRGPAAWLSAPNPQERPLRKTLCVPSAGWAAPNLQLNAVPHLCRGNAAMCPAGRGA